MNNRNTRLSSNANLWLQPFWYLEDATKGSLAEIFDVDDVVARVFQSLQTRVRRRRHTLIGRVVAQLAANDCRSVQKVS